MHRPELDWPLDRFDKEPADIDSGYIDGGEPSFRLILFLPLRRPYRHGMLPRRTNRASSVSTATILTCTRRRDRGEITRSRGRS